MRYKWSDTARTRDLMTLTQHAAEDGGGITAGSAVSARAAVDRQCLIHLDRLSSLSSRLDGEFEALHSIPTVFSPSFEYI